MVDEQEHKVYDQNQNCEHCTTTEERESFLRSYTMD